jgi:hypothetical protein
MVRIENLGAKNGILDKLPDMKVVPDLPKKDSTSTQSSFPMIVSEPVKIAGGAAGAGGAGSRDVSGTFITGTDGGQKEQTRKKYVPLVKESSGGLIN